jgi:hypothetical protein
MHGEITGIANSNYVTVSSSTGRATEPNSLSTVSYYRPIHELDKRTIKLLFPEGIRKVLWFRTGSGTHSALCNEPTGSASSGIKHLRCEVDGSSPFSQINGAIPLLPDSFIYVKEQLNFFCITSTKRLQILCMECAKVPYSCKDSQKSTSINYLASF